MHKTTTCDGKKNLIFAVGSIAVGTCGAAALNHALAFSAAQSKQMPDTFQHKYPDVWELWPVFFMTIGLSCLRLAVGFLLLPVGEAVIAHKPVWTAEDR